MGYSTSGSGDAVLKEGTDVKEIKQILDKVIGRYSDCIEYDVTDNVISFWETDNHWHEENLMAFLNALTPHITEGAACYSGEDDCYWKSK